MSYSEEMKMLSNKYIRAEDHSHSDYFGLIKELVFRRNRYDRGGDEFKTWQEEIDAIYNIIRDELINNQAKPTTPVKFALWAGVPATLGLVSTTKRDVV